MKILGCRPPEKSKTLPYLALPQRGYRSIIRFDTRGTPVTPTHLGQELRQQGLVRGDDVLALLEGLENHILGVGHAAHELHHAVDAVVFEDVCAAVEWSVESSGRQPFLQTVGTFAAVGTFAVSCCG